MVGAVAQAGSVTRASERIGLSQSALSHRLSNLERTLAVRLFDRIGKKMVPTLVGRALADSADDVLGRCAEAEHVITATARGADRTTVRVTTSCFSYYTWLAEALADFGIAKPDVDVNVLMQGARDEATALDNGSADFLVTAHPPNRAGLEKLRIFSQEVVAVAPIGHRLSRLGRLIGWSDLRTETLLIHDLPSTDEVSLRDAVWGRRRSASSKDSRASIRRVQLTEAILALVEAGFGIGIMNRWTGTSPFVNSKLNILPIAPRYDRTYWAVWRHDKAKSLPLAELARCISDRNARPTGVQKRNTRKIDFVRG
jgi:LysR family transcriptional regulator for metE and metH